MTRPAVSVADLDTPGERVRGPVLTPGDGGYDEERAVFQTARRHRPDVLVGATGPTHVGMAVSFAPRSGSRWPSRAPGTRSCPSPRKAVC